MSHFYSRCYGNRGVATRAGHKSTGITAEAFGHSLGGTVSLNYSTTYQADVVHLHCTLNGRKTLVATFTLVDEELRLLDSNFRALEQTKLPS
jgi:pimeloyl-ACP methyl ester carboxylesterase